MTRLEQRTPFYYGWINVALASLAMTATLPGRTHGLSLITEPLIEDLALSHEQFAKLNLGASLLGALFCLPAGFLVDRIGVRAVTTGIVAALAAATWWMSRVTTQAGLFVPLLLVRGFGQSALSVVSMAIIGKWFQRRVGIAMGVFAVLLTVGFIATVLTLDHFVKVSGWREAWRFVSFSLFAFVVPAAVLLRNSPESSGLRIDGDSQASASSDEPAPPVAHFRLFAALATPAFWVIALGSAAFNLTSSALTLFNESILKERGLGGDVPVLVLSALTGAGLVANLIAGALATRDRLLKLLGLALFVLAAVLAWFPQISTRTESLLYASGLGLSGGIITVVFFAAWGALFGRGDLGRIQGVAQLMCVVASSIGPLVFAHSEARHHSHSPAFYELATLLAVLALASVVVRLPEHATHLPLPRDEPEPAG